MVANLSKQANPRDKFGLFEHLIKGALDNFSFILNLFFQKHLSFLYH